MSGVSASTPSFSLKSRIQTSNWFCRPSNSVIPCLPHDHPLYSSGLKLKGIRIAATGGGEGGFQRTSVRCNSSSGPGGPGSGENDSRTVLDAFFLGKALAEALNERIESTVGEFLSTIGRLQAEQQKQVQDFQEDVLERAKRAKEKAAREAMETQGLIPQSIPVNTSAVTDGVTSTTPSSATDDITPAKTSPLSINTDPDPANNDPVVGVSSDD
ncbi:hypothetical protein L1049_005463 [Liquidambar formosana]|uniref:Uncharacterized protein n=1 Tax=Liquidambar formosana TaxID=63359 RepID=A0AAP0RUC6_LIQFO